MTEDSGAIWIILSLVVVLYEGFRWGKGSGTLTAHTRPVIRAVLWVKLVALAAWLWLGWHFFLDPVP